MRDQVHYVLAYAGLVLIIALLQQLCLRWSRRRPLARRESWPAVSILKPIKGADAGLYDNLVALVRQDYPDFEIVVAIAELDDPACDVVRRVQRDHPGASIRLVTGAPDIGYNPKVSNLAHAAAVARYELLLISDADARPDVAYLRGMVSALEPHTHLVHSLLAPDGEQSLGAALDHAHLGGIAASVAGADRVLGHPCVIGKSVLFRARDLETVGGWRAFKDVLAEDYLMGQSFVQAGLTVRIAPEPLRVHAPVRSLESFFARHVRWLHMRRCMTLSTFLLEPLFHPTLAFALIAVEWPGWALLGLVLHAVVEWSAMRRLRGEAPPWWMMLIVPLKDVAVLTAWLVAAVRQTVTWRGQRMRMTAGTHLLPVSGEDVAEDVAEHPAL
jgi:ceramide glucosyltransferase